MFVRFRETSRRLQLSLVETRREGGKVRHEHVASFGAIATPLTVAGRIELWQGLHQRLGHTINVKPGEKLSYLVTADEPGRWAYHCHLLYHMETGMFREVRVL